jgi:hypothetical protein
MDSCRGPQPATKTMDSRRRANRWVMGVGAGSEDAECGARNGNKIFGAEDILVDTELSGAPEVDRYVPLDEALHFADTIVAR